MTIITLPQLSLDMENGTLVSWNKMPGDTFRKGETLFEVESKKVVFEVASKNGGTIRDIYFEEGEQIDVGQAVLSVEYFSEEAQ